MRTGLAIIAGYLLGSIDFAVIISRMRGVDIHRQGSGNPGATNVARVIGKKEGAIVLAGDLLKGLAAAALGQALGGPVAAYAGGAAAVVGHCFPVWHGLRGGKGVATTGGMALWVAPVVGAVLAVVWVVAVAVTRTSSIGSLLAALLLVPGVALQGARGWSLVIAAAVAVLVIVRHHGNIGRLLRRRERPLRPG